MEKKSLDFRTKFTIFISVFIPGILTALTDFDIGQFATYIVASSIIGLKVFPILLFVFFSSLVIHSVNGRINIISGKGLLELLRENYGLKTSLQIFFLLILLNFGVLLQSVAGLKLAASLLHYNQYTFVILNFVFLYLIIHLKLYKNIGRLFIFVLMFYGAIFISSIYKLVLLTPHAFALQSSATFLDYIQSRKIPLITIALLGTTVSPWTLFYIGRYTYKTKLDLDKFQYFRLENYFTHTLLFITSFLLMLGGAFTFFGKYAFTITGTISHLLHPTFTPLATPIMGLGLCLVSLVSAGTILLVTAHIFKGFFGSEQNDEERLENGTLFKIIFLVLGFVAIGIESFFPVDLFSITIVVDFLNGIFLIGVLYYLYVFGNNIGLMGRYKNTLIHNIALIGIAGVIGILFFLVCFWQVISIFI